MRIRNFLRKITPAFLLQSYRKRQKERVRADLERQQKTGDLITVESLVTDLFKIGIKKGDTILVHSSMSKIGFLKDGPATFIEALKQVVGENGNIMMPTSPNAGLQLDYVRNNKIFNVLDSPSKMGAISEYFRKFPNVKRSLSPTEPVCVLGPNADFLTEGHLNELTPYTSKSPFCRLYDLNGKILYVGVTLDNAGTNLHTLEDAVDFPYPVYYGEIFEQEIIKSDGSSSRVQIKVHNPEWSKRRKCDDLIPMFQEEGACSEGRIGKAKTLIFDGKLMFDVLVKKFKSDGITMYHPHGIKAKD